MLAVNCVTPESGDMAVFHQIQKCIKLGYLLRAPVKGTKMNCRIEHHVASFSELHQILEKFQFDFNWMFRGQSNGSWPLVAKAGRSSFMCKNEIRYFEAWKRRAVEYVSSNPVDNWDWLSIAQHHGLATRLMDWSFNPLVAAFFAVNEKTECDSAIYAFKPKFRALREKVDPLEFKGVASFRPGAFAARIARQSGAFTVHGFLRGFVAPLALHGAGCSILEGETQAPH